MKRSLLLAFVVIIIAVGCKKKPTPEVASTYTITISSGPHGKISPPGVSGISTLEAGRSEGYSIIADSGYAIATLTIDGSAIIPTDTYLFSNISANHTISATFSKLYTITAIAGPNGTVNPTTLQVTVGANAGFSFTPSEGFHVDSVWLDGVLTQSNTNNYNIQNVTANHTIKVSFSDVLPQQKLDSLTNLLTGKWTMVKLNSKLGNLQDHNTAWDTQPLAACSSDQFDQFYANGTFQRNGNSAACDPLAYPSQQFQPRFPNHWTLKKNGKVIYLTDARLDSLSNIVVTKDSLIAFYYGGFDSIRGISYLYHYTRIQ